MFTQVPSPDPIAAPAPHWIFKVLLLVMFVLHLLAMNGVVGGAVIASIAHFRGRKKIAADVVRMIPTLLAATINLGVAVLLFAQVLYGQAIYTSSILMAWPWLLVIPILIVAYYGFYRASFKAKSSAEVAGPSLAVATLLVCVVAFIFVNNMTLAASPEKWASVYHADPSGWNMNLSEPSLVPRYAHFLLSAVAIGGLFVMGLGLVRWRRDAEAARPFVVLGGRWFMFITMAQFVIGFWFLLALPKDKMMLFMGEHPPATIYLGVAIVASFVGIVLIARAIRADDPRPLGRAGMGVMGLVVVLMVLMRDTLRVAHLEPWIRPAEFPVQAQWGPFALFLAVFALGIAVFVWMLVRYFRGLQPESTP